MGMSLLLSIDCSSVMLAIFHMIYANKMEKLGWLFDLMEMSLVFRNIYEQFYSKKNVTPWLESNYFYWHHALTNSTNQPRKQFLK